MDFGYSAKTEEYRQRVIAFMDAHIHPSESELVAQLNEGERWKALPLLEQLKDKARAEGLWNLFLPETDSGAGLTNLEYAPLAELMGRSRFASEVFNCSAPDTGSMQPRAG